MMPYWKSLDDVLARFVGPDCQRRKYIPKLFLAMLEKAAAETVQRLGCGIKQIAQVRVWNGIYSAERCCLSANLDVEKWRLSSEANGWSVS